jgi:hypothetical protein
MLDVELLKGHHDARRQFVEKTFARHTHRAQLARIRAKILLAAAPGIRGQQVRYRAEGNLPAISAQAQSLRFFCAIVR